MDHYQIEELGFKGRSAQLEQITRFSLYPTTFYRNNLYKHTLRVKWIAQDLHPTLQSAIKYDAAKVDILSLVHDDPEIITGDVQLGRKLYTMTPDQLKEEERKTRDAAHTLAKEWPKEIKGHSYLQLLLEAISKSSIEAQVLSLADKLDAFGEAWHEFYAGNTCFLSHPELPPKTNPIQTYKRVMADFDSKFPALAPAFRLKHPLLNRNFDIDEEAVARQGSPHTPASIMKPTRNPHYDAWKRITLSRAGIEGMRWLTHQKEFLAKAQP